ncbi:MAG: 5'-nucleotidase C-terminal domain-containing protein, partial [Oscillospiraceae bacterium]
FSGLRMEFAPAAEAGTRIHSITDDKGNPIDPKRIYSVAIMDTIVPEKFILSCEETDVFISDLLTDNIQANYPISPPKDNRFIICQP